MILRNERTGAEFTVPPEGVRLGRDPSLDITFPEDDDVVSGLHCRVVRHDDNSWWLEDLGSTNGTWLNGQRLGEPARLFTGMKFSLGQRGPVLKVSVPGEIARTQAEPAVSLGLPQVRLRRVKGGEDLHGAGIEIVLGRSTSCTIPLRSVADTVVSKRHASISFDEFGNAFLTDLASRNGTYLNGNAVQGRTKLRPGDRIMLGWQGPMFEVRTLGSQSLAEHEGAPYVPEKEPRRSLEGMVAMSGHEAKGEGRFRTGVFVKSMARQIAHDTSPGFRIVMVVLFVALIATIVLVYMTSSQRIAEAEARRAEAERAISQQVQQNSQLQARADSQVTDLRRQLDDARKNAVSPGLVQSLERRLHEQESLANLRSMAPPPASGATPAPGIAPNTDFTSVVRDNMRSVGMVIVRYPNDSVMGSGFAITPSGYFITNRHVVQPEGRLTPRQIVVVMAETNAALTADVLSVSSVSGQDVAVLKIRGFTGTPVRAIDWQGRDVQQGAQAALVGFPFGRAYAVDQAGVLHATIFGGLIAATGELIRFSASTYVGVSGSPLFNMAGEVIAVHYGAPVAGAGLGFALPMRTVQRWLPPEAKAELGL